MIAQFVVTPKRLLALIAMEKSTFNATNATEKVPLCAANVMEREAASVHCAVAQVLNWSMILSPKRINTEIVLFAILER